MHKSVEDFYVESDRLRERAVRFMEGDAHLEPASAAVLALASLALEVRALGFIIANELKEASWPLKRQ